MSSYLGPTEPYDSKTVLVRAFDAVLEALRIVSIAESSEVSVAQVNDIRTVLTRAFDTAQEALKVVIVGGEIAGDTTFTDDVDIDGSLSVGDGTPLVPLTSGAVFVTQLLQLASALISLTAEWGASIISMNSADSAVVHNGVGNFDLTGGAYESLFTATTQTGGWSFTTADVTRLLIITSGSRLGAVAEIEDFVSATQVILKTAGWDDDLTGASFIILEHPALLVADGVFISESIGAGEKHEIHGFDHTRSEVFEVEANAAGPGVRLISAKMEAEGQPGTSTTRFAFSTGAIPAGSILGLNIISIDETEAVDDSSTEIAALLLETTNETSVHRHAIHVNPGFAAAVSVNGQEAVNPDYGYEVTAAHVPTDRVHSAGAGDDAFINAAVNVAIFDANGDYILIGNDNTFGVLAVLVVNGGNKSITPTFEYSTGDGTWSTLSVVDSTNGMKVSGNISFEAPGDWAKSSHCEGGTGVITNALYIRITRARISLLTLPVEHYFKVYEGGRHGFLIRGDGTIKPRAYADADEADITNDSIYYNTTDSVLRYKDSVGGYHDLY